MKFIENRFAALLYSHQSASELIVSSATVERATLAATCMNVPVHFLLQLLQVGDKRFFYHPGVDPIAIIRAIIANSTGTGATQGASTITQQLCNVRLNAKGIYLHRTPTYKVLQIAWALIQEILRTKYEIISEYLDGIYWGRSYYGIDAAAWGYFRAVRDEITVAQSFFLVERLASPNLLIINRVRALLQGRTIVTMFVNDTRAREELVTIYEEHFQSGDQLSDLLTATFDW